MQRRRRMRGKRRRRKREGKEKGGEKEKKKRWKGGFAKQKNRRRVAARCQGVGKQNCQGEPGETLGFEVRWVWAGLGHSLAILKTFFYFAK